MTDFAHAYFRGDYIVTNYSRFLWGHETLCGAVSRRRCAVNEMRGYRRVGDNSVPFLKHRFKMVFVLIFVFV